MPEYVHVAEALVTHPESGEVLVVRNPTSWSLPAGRVESGETFREAAVRETFEEAAVHVHPLGVVLVTERQPAEGSHELFITFAARYVSGEPDAGADEDVREARWVPPTVADDLIDFLPVPVADLIDASPGVIYEETTF